MKITKGQLRRIIREELAREAIDDDWDPTQQTRWSDMGPRPEDEPVSEEEDWVARVGSGEIDRGSVSRDARTGPVQDAIDDTETYLDAIKYDIPGESGAMMYGTEDEPYDPMCDVDDPECAFDSDPRYESELTDDMTDWEMY